jgi:hypothetical protein
MIEERSIVVPVVRLVQAKSQKPKAKSQSYLRNTHIAQPATSTPPKNIAKQ